MRTIHTGAARDLAGAAAPAACAGRPADLLRALPAAAAITQPALLDEVGAPFGRCWPVNALATRATKAEIRALKVRPGVPGVSSRP